ncbi:MAG: substrate-binding domain-containing protein [Fimbriimonas sp.]|nr:substrate-binding domain-containing protein [Fimbriimonas sp.]
MKFKHILWGAAALGILAAIGCGSSDNPAPSATTDTAGGTKTGAAPKKKDYKIVMIAKSSSNPVFAAAQTGANDAAKELGAKNGVNITIDWRTPNDEDPHVQAQRIGQAVNDGADAVLVSCSNAEILTGAINDAVDKGVPVMTFDSDAPKSKRFAFYGADDIACGTQVMSELSKIIGGKGNVAILAGSQNAPNLQKRVQGAQDEAKKYPGIKIVGVFNHAETAEDASAEVNKDMNSHPEITAWAMIGGWPLFATSLLTLDPNKVKIVSVDALPQELPYIEKGIAPVLLAQPVYDWGYKSVGIIVDKVILGKDVPTINKMDLVKVSNDNLGDWAQTLKKWGFAVDAKYLAMAKTK